MRTTTRTVALVPMHALVAAKSRLGGELRQAERGALALWLGGRVVAALRASERVAAIGVVSPDEAVLAWARSQGATPIRQRTGGLNEGLEEGRAWALAQGAEALLVLLGDLPLLAPEDVAALVRAAQAMQGAESVVCAPDRAGQGTNGLLISPATLLPFAFGEGSLARHTALARAAGVEPLRLTTPGLSFDVDTPADLAELRERHLWPATSVAGVPPAHATIGANKTLGKEHTSDVCA